MVVGNLLMERLCISKRKIKPHATWSIYPYQSAASLSYFGEIYKRVLDKK